MSAAPRLQNSNIKEDKKFEKTAIVGLFAGLAGIYITLLISFPSAAGADAVNTPFSFAAGIGMIAAIVWAADAVRKVSKYGLGTGVPSVGMFGIGIACVMTVFSISLNTLWSPIIGAALALVIGWVSGKLINKTLGMNIPDMEKRISEITAGCTLAMISSVVVVTGSVQNIIGYEYVTTGVIALGFIGIAVAVFHAYNANLGPDEMKDRTRMLAILDASMILTIFAVAGLFWRMGQETGIQTIIGLTVTIFMSIVFIFIAYYKFWTYVKRDAWQIAETGLLPSEEDLN